MPELKYSSKKKGYTDKHDTESGLSRDQSATLANWEHKRHGNKIEFSAVVDKNGRLLEERRGGSSSVLYRPDFAKDNVVVHNHPKTREVSESSIAGRIGQPLSPEDLASIRRSNGSEMRARTATHLYSVKRPKGGWNQSTDINKIYKNATYSAAHKHVMGLKNAPAYDSQQYHDHLERTLIALLHQAAKSYAKESGAKYTRRRVK